MLTPAQLEERKKGIGGSEIAAIFGLDRFRGPLDVWLSKVGEWDAVVGPDIERGNFLEDGIANWYAHREKVLAIGAIGARVHSTRPFARCTPDRIAEVEPVDGAQHPTSERLVSIKSPRRAIETPEGHVLQLQWEDAICASNGDHWLPTFHLVSLEDGDLKIVPVERDVELQKWLLDYAEDWWTRHVVAGVPPPLDGTEGAGRWLKKRFPRSTNAPARMATLDESVALMELRVAEEAFDAASKSFEVAAQKVKEAVGDAGGIESAVVGKVTWRSDRNGKRTFKTNWSKKQ